MPEHSGKLPRAPIPEGSADTRVAPADADAPPPPPATPATPPAPTPAAPAPAKKDLSISWGGFVRIQGIAVQDDALPFIGRNDGFRLGNVRLGMETHYKDALSGFVSIEAAVARSPTPNSTDARLGVELRDAYLSYEVSPALALRLGRFKAPYDLGELEVTPARVFIDEPLESRGVVATEGIELRGMATGRQIGLMMMRDRLGLSRDGFDLGYALAITNGRTQNLAFNDNDKPAGFARLSLRYGAWGTLNLGGFIDPRTVGNQPDLFDEDVLGAESSLQLRFEGLRIEGQFLLQHTRFATTEAPDQLALGWHAQWAYRIWGLEAAYRYAWYDPNDLYDLDLVQEHTLGLSYYPDGLPLRFSANGTFAFEQREVSNHRLVLLVQWVFDEIPD